MITFGGVDADFNKVGRTFVYTSDIPGEGGCRPSATTLCLNNRRFRVNVSWEDFEGHTGLGNATNLTQDTGYFWYFDESNVEMVIKVLDDENRGWIADWASGIEHVIDLHEEDNGIRVDAINMSLVSNAEFESVCDSYNPVFSEACNRARDLGIALFASSAIPPTAPITPEASSGMKTSFSFGAEAIFCNASTYLVAMK